MLNNPQRKVSWCECNDAEVVRFGNYLLSVSKLQCGDYCWGVGYQPIGAPVGIVSTKELAKEMALQSLCNLLIVKRQEAKAELDRLTSLRDRIL